jgi:hypothetical protein
MRGQSLELSNDSLTRLPGHTRVADFMMRFETMCNALGREGKKGRVDSEQQERPEPTWNILGKVSCSMSLEGTQE